MMLLFNLLSRNFEKQFLSQALHIKVPLFQSQLQKGTKAATAPCRQNRSRKIRIGWLHRSSGHGGKFKQVRFKDGGGIREFIVSEGDDTTISSLKEKGKKLFFPSNNSPRGPLSSMNVDLGNFSQQKLDSFTDTDGKECDFFAYLKSHGLYASRCYLYLMTTIKEESSEDEEIIDDDPSEVIFNTGLNNMVLERSTQSSSLERKDAELKKNLYTVCDSVGNILCRSDEHDQHNLTITYEKITESSYSEVISRYQCLTRAQCFETSTLMDPEVFERKAKYDPLDEGFTISSIEKGNKCFLREIFLDLEDDGSSFPSYHYPSVSDKENKLILHHPTEVWGFDDGQLIVAVVTSQHMSPDISYTWFKDEIELKSGKEYCCIRVDAEGKYSVVVKNAETVETSELIHIKHAQTDCSKKDESRMGSLSSCLPARRVDDEPHTSNLPMIRKSDFLISPDGEIGRGTFGTVFKGEWAGTPVAIKRIKMRRPSMIQSALNSEVRIHSMLRHPNIVQIMAVAMEKNELYIISEYVDGSNLEDLLFSSEEVDILLTTKNSIAMHCAQAVAYLHALNPPVIHRDIKPANVLVSRVNHIAKICDMGISRLKAIQTMDQSSVSGIPGTPSYMAPECLLKNEKATVHSDIWSLACTLLEMYTEKDCWEIEDNDTQLETLSNPCNALMRNLNNKEVPLSLESSDIDIAIKETLRRCFDYVPAKRPNALELVTVFKT